MSGLRLELLGNMPEINLGRPTSFDERVMDNPIIDDYRRPTPADLNNDFQPQTKTDMSFLTEVGDWLNKNSDKITKVSTQINTAVSSANQLFNQPVQSGGGYNSPILQQPQAPAPPPEEKDNTLTYVAIAAGGLLLTGIAVAVIKKKKKKRAGLGRVSKSRKLKVKRIKTRKPVARKSKTSKKKNRKRSRR